MSELFLTEKEILQLTGKKRPTAQCAFLASQGYHFRTDACGQPVVLQEEVRRRFGLTEPQPAAKASADREPDLDWAGMASRGMIRDRGKNKNSKQTPA